MNRSKALIFRSRAKIFFKDSKIKGIGSILPRKQIRNAFSQDMFSSAAAISPPRSSISGNIETINTTSSAGRLSRSARVIFYHAVALSPSIFAVHTGKAASPAFEAK